MSDSEIQDGVEEYLCARKNILELDYGYPERIKRVGILTEVEHQIALNENEGWSQTPITKLSMLGNKGLIGRYGTVYEKNELTI